MPEDRTSTADVVLWTLTCVMALALFLLAPQLGTDNTGRVFTALMSVAIFACSIHPTLHSPWLRSNISRRIVLCFVRLLGTTCDEKSLLNSSPFAPSGPVGRVLSIRAYISAY